MMTKFTSLFVFLFLITGCLSPDGKLGKVLDVTGTRFEGVSKSGNSTGECTIEFVQYNSWCDVKINYSILGYSVQEKGGLTDLKLTPNESTGTVAIVGNWDNFDDNAGDGVFVLACHDDVIPNSVIIKISNQRAGWIHYAVQKLDKEKYNRIFEILEGKKSESKQKTRKTDDNALENISDSTIQGMISEKIEFDNNDTDIGPVEQHSAVESRGEPVHADTGKLSTLGDAVQIFSGSDTIPGTSSESFLEEDRIYNLDAVEVQPEFPGGNQKIQEFTAMNMKYPELEKEAGTQGKVYVQIIISKEGFVENVRILRGLSQGLNAEAIRIVNLMPRWTPARIADQPVNCRYNLPIEFKLNR